MFSASSSKWTGLQPLDENRFVLMANPPFRSGFLLAVLVFILVLFFPTQQIKHRALGGLYNLIFR